MQESLKTILMHIEHIEKRPLIYTSEANFQTMSNFISGYLFGVETTYAFNLNTEFSDWLNRNGKQTSLFWTVYISIKLANNDEALAYQLIFTKLKEFLEEKISAE